MGVRQGTTGYDYDRVRQGNGKQPPHALKVEDPRVPNLRIQAIALGHSTALSAGSGCKWPLTRKHSYRIVHP